VRRDVVILACAISAGIHGALVPSHGLAFAAATVALAGVAVAATLRPAGTTWPAGAVAVLGGLVVAYALTTTTGLPVLHPEREAVEGLALATKAIELVGLLAALSLIRKEPERWTRHALRAQSPSS
jgi:hypothetical protein